MSTPVNPVTLRFLDPALERTYVEERMRRRSVRQTLISYALTICAWIGVGAWSVHALPGERTIAAITLGGCVPVLLMSAILTTWRVTRRLMVRLDPLVDFLIGVSVVLIQALLPGRVDQELCTAFVLFLMAVHTLMGLRFLVATTITFALVLLYFVVVIWVSPMPGTIALGNMIWLGSAHLFGMRVSYIEERARKRDFFQNRLLDAERSKSEALLLNILPSPIVKRLKDAPMMLADGFDDVTVLFADLVGFTALSAQMKPADLVGLLNRLFSTFDEIAERHSLEKIKTIGDAYMVAGGLPIPRPDHTRAVVEMALELVQVTESLAEGSVLAMRIGIHRGPVVAGVIGKKKYSYDLWGDTVNIASRMESHGRPGFIHVSSEVRDALVDEYEFETRGPVEIKGKGTMNTYWLTGRVPRLGNANPSN